MPFEDRDDGSIFYVEKETTLLFERSKPTPDARPKDPFKTELLWGDRVRLLRNPDGSFRKENNRHRARARGQYGWIAKADLGRQPLLEIYFIDVGQGDGLLIRTPNGRHILIDGGWPRRSQPTGKNAADFVDWKFMKDYEAEDDAIELDAMICSHNDQDHYGGLWDLLNPGQEHELDAEQVFIEHFYHAGLSWWKKGAKGRTLSTPVETTQGRMYTRLLGDRDSIQDGLRSDATPRLQGEWAKFLKRVSEAKTREGDPTPARLLTDAVGTLPGFDGGKTPGISCPEPRIHVLAPVEFGVDGKVAIRHFEGGESKNTNGNSVLLRVDCGKVRVLLTGDLNTVSQNSLLKDYQGREKEFECDVAKACHHGSGDVSFPFLDALDPLVTVISSGDSEGHDHPKPEIIAASAASGHVRAKGDKMETPLVFITELARTVELGRIDALHRLGADGEPTGTVDGEKLQATAKVIKAGDRNASTVRRRLANQRLATKTVYGLINVRTDGKKILCAALNEKSSTWNTVELKPKTRP